MNVRWSLIIGLLTVWQLPDCFGQCLVEQSDASYEKTVRKQVRKYTKKGYESPPGLPSLTNQLLCSYAIQSQKDAEGNAIYLLSVGSASSKSRNLARIKAVELAKLDMANGISSQVDLEIQINQRELHLDDKTKSLLEGFAMRYSSQTVQQLIGNQIVFEAFRETSDGYYYDVRLTIKAAAALESARMKIRQMLGQQNILNPIDLDKILPPNG